MKTGLRLLARLAFARRRPRAAVASRHGVDELADGALVGR
jgi:hypothetical protein